MTNIHLFNFLHAADALQPLEGQAGQVDAPGVGRIVHAGLFHLNQHLLYGRIEGKILRQRGHVLFPGGTLVNARQFDYQIILGNRLAGQTVALPKFIGGQPFFFGFSQGTADSGYNPNLTFSAGAAASTAAVDQNIGLFCCLQNGFTGNPFPDHLIRLK